MVFTCATPIVALDPIVFPLVYSEIQNVRKMYIGTVLGHYLIYTAPRRTEIIDTFSFISPIVNPRSMRREMVQVILFP